MSAFTGLILLISHTLHITPSSSTKELVYFWKFNNQSEWTIQSGSPQWETSTDCPESGSGKCLQLRGGNAADSASITIDSTGYDSFRIEIDLETNTDGLLNDANCVMKYTESDGSIFIISGVLDLLAYLLGDDSIDVSGISEFYFELAIDGDATSDWCFWDDLYIYGIPKQDIPVIPTSNPSIVPTSEPSHYPSMDPSLYPSTEPTSNPTILTLRPSINPTINPSVYPTANPTMQPSVTLSILSTITPSGNPTLNPTALTPYPSTTSSESLSTSTTLPGTSVIIEATSKSRTTSTVISSDPTDPKKSTADSTLMALVIGGIAVLCCIVIAVLIILMKCKREKNRKYRIDSEISTVKEDNNSDAVNMKKRNMENLNKNSKRNVQRKANGPDIKAAVSDDISVEIVGEKVIIENNEGNITTPNPNDISSSSSDEDQNNMVTPDSNENVYDDEEDDNDLVNIQVGTPGNNVNNELPDDLGRDEFVIHDDEDSIKITLGGGMEEVEVDHRYTIEGEKVL